MRGKDIRQTERRIQPGITPAYAGKSSISRDSLTTLKDHPRLCGEKSNIIFTIFAFSGSPPPMRGKAPDL